MAEFLRTVSKFRKSKKKIAVHFYKLTSSIKREIRKFHVKDVRRRQRNVSGSVMHEQSCCCCSVSLIKRLLFCRSCCCLHLKPTVLIFSLLWFLKTTSIFGQFQKLFEKILRWRNSQDVHSTITFTHNRSSLSIFQSPRHSDT